MLLIDAYNVLATAGVLPPRLAGPGLGGLVSLIEGSRYRDLRARLVCDGGPGNDIRRRGGLMLTEGGLSWCRLGRAEVVFSGSAREADDVIEEVLDRSTFASRMVVISSDRRVAQAATRAGADSVSSDGFLHHLVEDESRAPGEALPAFVSDVPLDHYSVLHWMREFGYEPREGGVPRAVDASGNKKRAKSPTRKGGAHKGGSNKGGTERPRRAGSPDPDVSAPVEPIEPEASRPKAGPVEEPVTDDPLLAQAFREWAGRLSLEDLEMDRWVDGVDKLKRRGR
ncbi:MAG: NYN domain-containing protein [Planctomycetota bacterium]